MRQYNDPCGLARALNLVGERWALLIVRELLLGPKRFSDVREGLSGISPNVLSQRLTSLVERGIVEQKYLGPPTNANVYQLTSVGKQLEPALLALADWGSRAVAPSGGELSMDALLLAMRTTANLDRPHRPGVYQLFLDDDAITVEVSEFGLSMKRHTVDQPVATVTMPPAVLRAVMFGDRTLHNAVQAGEASVTGSLDDAESFFGLFDRPRLIERPYGSPVTRHSAGEHS